MISTKLIIQTGFAIRLTAPRGQPSCGNIFQHLHGADQRLLNFLSVVVFVFSSHSILQRQYFFYFISFKKERPGRNFVQAYQVSQLDNVYFMTFSPLRKRTSSSAEVISILRIWHSATLSMFSKRVGLSDMTEKISP